MLTSITWSAKGSKNSHDSSRPLLVAGLDDLVSVKKALLKGKIKRTLHQICALANSKPV